MVVRGNLIAIAVAVSFGALMLQGIIIDRSLQKIIQRETSRTALEDYARFTRQDIAGILLALGFTNGLLGAILAVLIFR